MTDVEVKQIELLHDAGDFDLCLDYEDFNPERDQRGYGFPNYIIGADDDLESDDSDETVCLLNSEKFIESVQWLKIEAVIDIED